MKEVIAHYIEVANILDDAGHIQEAQEFTDRAVKVAQLKGINANQNIVATYKQMIENDAAKAAERTRDGRVVQGHRLCRRPPRPALQRLAGPGL